MNNYQENINKKRKELSQKMLGNSAQDGMVILKYVEDVIDILLSINNSDCISRHICIPDNQWAKDKLIQAGLKINEVQIKNDKNIVLVSGWNK